MNPEDLVAREEGFRPYAYQDSLGYWTIGFGKLIDKRKGGGITEAQARRLLKDELDGIYVALDANLPWWRNMNEVRGAVLVSMAFQLGMAGLLKFTRTLAAMKSGDYLGAARGMMASKWARTDSPNRATRACLAMETGTWSELTRAMKRAMKRRARRR